MKKETRNTIIKWSLYALLVIATIVITVFSSQIFGQNYHKVLDEFGDWNGKDYAWDIEPMFYQIKTGSAFGDYFLEHAIPNTLRTIQVAGVAITFAIALHYLAKIVFRSKKGKTISRLLVSFIKWAIALTAVFFILDAWGVPATATLTGAGVLALIIGLGSQSLVADILAGIFIVFEGEFQVGDIVIIDGWRGEVKEIGMRTTKLLDAGGNVKIVNNSEIKTIINQTQELSLAKANVSVSYNVRIEKVEAVIADNIAKIKEKIPAIEEGPFYKGVTELGESGVGLLFVAKCKEDDIYQVQRDLNREIKIMFDDNNIEIPFNQLVVHMGEDADQQQVSKQDIRKADRFNEEQKELSQDISVEK
ncbi:MAG: mechanosensitive ion channel family protein [Bacilli bacterium]|nr:mechanosensitive ion channel family protein [Bacilli bacterium]